MSEVPTVPKDSPVVLTPSTTYWFSRDDEPENDGNFNVGSVAMVRTFETAGAHTVVLRVTDVNGVLEGLVLSGGTNPTGTITLTTGSTDYNDADFGYTGALGSIGNLVFRDIDNDGFHDPDEPGIGGVTIDLWVDILIQ